MSINGKTKGMAMEKTIEQLAMGEAVGGMMYYALARTARSLGLEEVAKKFIELGNQETNHAGFYATLAGKYPGDKDAFWRMVKGLSAAEMSADSKVNALADKLAELGLDKEIVDEVRVFAAQEKHHGEVTKAILEKYAPEYANENPSKRKYVCAVCGYEYEGEMSDLPDDWKCSVCGMPKTAFKLKV